MISIIIGLSYYWDKKGNKFLIYLMVLTWIGTSRCLFKYYLNENKLLWSNFFSLHDILFRQSNGNVGRHINCCCWSCYFSQQATYFKSVYRVSSAQILNVSSVSPYKIKLLFSYVYPDKEQKGNILASKENCQQ